MAFQKVSGDGAPQQRCGHWVSGAGLHGNQQWKRPGINSGVAPVLGQFLTQNRFHKGWAQPKW